MRIGTQWKHFGGVYEVLGTSADGRRSLIRDVRFRHDSVHDILMHGNGFFIVGSEWFDAAVEVDP